MKRICFLPVVLLLTGLLCGYGSAAERSLTAGAQSCDGGVDRINGILETIMKFKNGAQILETIGKKIKK